MGPGATVHDRARGPAAGPLMTPEGLTPEEIREFNTRYHDTAADGYDFKWGIDFGPSGQSQVLSKLGKALGGPIGHYRRSLEVGCGTGYFSLNLLQAGVVDEAVCTDISPGMLEVLRANAERIGVRVRTLVSDAERLRFPDASFDLVFGHAVLHHIPALDRAFAEFHRVLRPEGKVAFAGEPSLYGDRIAAVPKRAALALAPWWRFAMRAAHARAPGGHGGADPILEHLVDVHAFTPQALVRAARSAGFEGVRVRGEELLANWFGWVNRALEATAEPSEVPWLWRQYAYRGYLLLQQVDRRLLEPRLPPAIFYNLTVAGAKAAARARPQAGGRAGLSRRSRP